MKLQHMTWPQVQKYFEKNDTVIIGVGSCENHGKHMPLGTDALVPEKIIALIEEKIEVVCAPVIPFGSCEYFTDFPGTVSLGDEVLYQVVHKVAEGLYHAGARHFVFVNGHGGGEETAAIMYINEDWIDRSMMEPGDIEDVTPEIKARTLKVAEYKGVQVTIPRDSRPICGNGWVGPDPIENATVEWGREMLNTVADYIADFTVEFAKAPLK